MPQALLPLIPDAGRFDSSLTLATSQDFCRSRCLELSSPEVMWVRTYTHFSWGGRPPGAADHHAKKWMIDQMQDDASSFMPRAAARLRRAALPEAPVPAEASRRGSRQNASLRFERAICLEARLVDQ